MAMYNKFITFLMLTFIVSISFAQQYTPMTAAGYQYKRAKVDSTLHIPSFCGVPNLRNSTAIQGALAMDTCGNKLYQWTHAAGWSTISTNAIDSLKRSNDSIFARKSGVWVFQYKDSVGGGGTTPSLQDVATVGNYYINDFGDTLKLNSYDNNNKHPLLWVNDQYNTVNILDFSYNTGFNQNVASIKFGDSTNTLATGYIKITDKESYFKNELSQRTIIQNAPSISGSNQITYFPLMKDGTDTLATTEDVRNSAIDTSNKWVNNIYRTSGVDSIYYTIGSTTYAIKDSAGGGSSQNGRFGNDTATVVMAKIHNNSGTTLTNGKVVFMASSGTNSDAPSVRLANNKHDSTSANTFGFVSGSIANNDTGWIILSGKIEKLNTSAFANGDIIYLDSVSGDWTKTKPVAPYHMVYLGVVVKANNGNGSIFVKCQNGYELDEIHDVQITNKLNNQILVYSDTQKVWKNRNVYSVVDTSSLSNRINLKVNISDTATMLSPYLRNNIASATYLQKSDSTTYYTKYRSDTSRTNIYNALLGKQETITLTTTGTSGASTLVGNTLNIPQYAGTTYTFSTGLTNSANTITNNLSTGVAGGQSVIGGTAASNSLTLSSTSNATKGKLLFGTSAYDEVNNRLGIGTTSPSFGLDVNSATRLNGNTTFGSTGFWDNTNIRLGINTTSPTASLHIVDNVGSASTGDNVVRIESTAGTIGPSFRFKSFSGADYIMTATGSGNTGGAGAFRIMDLAAGGINRIWIAPTSGNVLINTATDAGYKLDVQGTGRFVTSLLSPVIYGSTANSGTLTLIPTTSGGFKGMIKFGFNSSYDDANTRLGLNTNSPAYTLDVNGTARASQYYLSALNTAPATASSTGTTGEIRIDANYIYICTATNTWKRVAIATW